MCNSFCFVSFLQFCSYTSGIKDALSCPLNMYPSASQDRDIWESLLPEFGRKPTSKGRISHLKDLFELHMAHTCGIWKPLCFHPLCAVLKEKLCQLLMRCSSESEENTNSISTLIRFSGKVSCRPYELPAIHLNAVVSAPSFSLKCETTFYLLPLNQRSGVYSEICFSPSLSLVNLKVPGSACRRLTELITIWVVGPDSVISSSGREEQTSLLMNGVLKLHSILVLHK